MRAPPLLNGADSLVYGPPSSQLIAPSRPSRENCTLDSFIILLGQFTLGACPAGWRPTGSQKARLAVVGSIKNEFGLSSFSAFLLSRPGAAGKVVWACGGCWLLIKRGPKGTTAGRWRRRADFQSVFSLFFLLQLQFLHRFSQ